ncbi:MAG: M28 family peptidase, partial [Vicinamibacterales bacterium]
MIARAAAFVLLTCVATGQTARPSSVIDSAQLLRDLQTLSADDMQGRQVDTPGGEKARTFVIERFKASGIVPFGDSYTEPFTFAGGRGAAAADRHGVNVVGHIDGTASPRKYIVVSAHYDHLGVRNGVVFNGADDNASGTAALFAVAKYFSQHRPSHSVIFVAFDGEEAGLRGARAFVQQPPVDASTLAVDLNMD